eukprot:Rmarinus@m.27541
MVTRKHSNPSANLPSRRERVNIGLSNRKNSITEIKPTETSRVKPLVLKDLHQADEDLRISTRRAAPERKQTELVTRGVGASPPPPLENKLNHAQDVPQTRAAASVRFHPELRNNVEKPVALGTARSFRKTPRSLKQSYFTTPRDLPEQQRVLWRILREREARKGKNSKSASAPGGASEVSRLNRGYDIVSNCPLSREDGGPRGAVCDDQSAEPAKYRRKLDTFASTIS